MSFFDAFEVKLSYKGVIIVKTVSLILKRILGFVGLLVVICTSNVLWFDTLEDPIN